MLQYLNAYTLKKEKNSISSYNVTSDLKHRMNIFSGNHKIMEWFRLEETLMIIKAHPPAEAESPCTRPGFSELHPICS